MSNQEEKKQESPENAGKSHDKKIVYTNQQLLSIAFEINKEFNKYNLSMEDAEGVMERLSTRCFLFNKNKCTRDGVEIFRATISADF